MTPKPGIPSLDKFADTWRRAYWAHREVPGRHRGECCQDECWPDIAQRVVDEIAPAIIKELEVGEPVWHQHSGWHHHNDSRYPEASHTHMDSADD